MTAPGFDDLMGHVASPMAILTTVADGARAGCLVGFHAQSSIDPPRYTIWLSVENHTCKVAREAGMFAVHLLGADDHDLAELFGGETGDEVDKFERCEWSEGPGGVPVLAGPPAVVVGRRRELIDELGDHVCLVIEPTDVTWDGSSSWLTLPDVLDIDPGHPVEGDD